MKSLRSQRVGIDQIGRLIVGHDADSQPAILIVLGQSTKRRGFSGSQKTADHDVANRVRHCSCLCEVSGNWCRLRINGQAGIVSHPSPPTTPRVVMSDLPDNPQPPAWPLPDEAVEAALRRAFADGSWGKYHGPNCRELSARLAAMHGCEHIVLTCSGTAAVELALRGLRIGPGDEVILSAYDFEGNFKNVLAVGAKPVLVDVDPVSGQLDTNQLEAARSLHTKAIIASHLHGGVVAMPAVRAFADQHQIAVLEDACQMPGAIVHGRIAGTWGDVGVLSFGGSKLLTAGRGGAARHSRCGDRSTNSSADATRQRRVSALRIAGGGACAAVGSAGRTQSVASRKRVAVVGLVERRHRVAVFRRGSGVRKVTPSTAR